MIDAHRTGAYISSLRKARDWTQLELAEKLHVTHQAVSQWEKGASFPDISLLPGLARLLGVTADDLLNGQAAGRARGVSRVAMVEEFARGNAGEVARLVKDDPDGLETMLETAPLARPSQMDAVVSNLAGFDFTLEQATRLAPFVSQPVLETMIAHVDPERIDGQVLVQLAPFVADHTLDRLAQRLTPGTLTAEEVEGLAPFLGSATLKAQVLGLLDAGQPLGLDQLGSLAPFLEKATLEALIERLPDEPLDIEQVVALAPFIGEATLDRLLTRLASPSQIGDHLTDLAPFLSQAGLRQAVAQNTGALTAETLLELAPFLEQDTLDALVRKGARR